MNYISFYNWLGKSLSSLSQICQTWKGYISYRMIYMSMYIYEHIGQPGLIELLWAWPRFESNDHSSIVTPKIKIKVRGNDENRQNTYQFSKVRELRRNLSRRYISRYRQCFAPVPVISVEEGSLYIPGE